MQAMEILTMSLPEHWMPAVLFGDLSNLNATESSAFRRWVVDTIRDVGHGKDVRIGNVKDEPYFEWSHDAAEYGVPGCMCVAVDVLVVS